MGGCQCSVAVKPTDKNYGGQLQWYWCEGTKCGYFKAYPRWCNPMNCSNTKCYKNGCSNARADYCAKHGCICPSKGGRRICTNESCPGGAICGNCTNNPAWHNLFNVPLCKDVKTTQTGPGVKSTPTGASKADKDRLGVDVDCANYGGLGGFGEWFCIRGKEVTKAVQGTGEYSRSFLDPLSKYMPIFLMMGVAMALIYVVRK